ncbi:MAG: hydrogenase maturation protease [Bacteroidetes bacterium]|nr:hydrogenase maturation protease [Bacteroidota bacterium]
MENRLLRAAPDMPEKTILVLGVGNILLSDEGVGVQVAQRLQAMNLPPEVEVVDGGTAGYELIEFFRNKKKVVVVDCLRADEPPGSIIRASPDELDLQWQTPLSVHQSGLRELLQHAASLSPSPEIVILGIVPENTDSPGMNLSKTVEGVIDRVISDVSALISA